MDNVSIYNYNGSDITFLNDENVMVNATQMAKNFGNSKRPQFWLNSQQSEEYINALSVARNLATADLVQIRQGGNPQLQGTWMHQDVALEFARWLSPAFAIWTNDRIKELLTTGVTTVSNDDEMIAHAMMILQKRLEVSKQQLQILEGKNEIQKQQIEILAPKAQYTDEVLQSASTFTTSQIAQGLNMTANALNRKLKELGVQYNQSGTWLLYAKYKDKGLSKIRVHTESNNRTNISRSHQYTVWTEKGRKFIHDLIQKT